MRKHRAVRTGTNDTMQPRFLRVPGPNDRDELYQRQHPPCVHKLVKEPAGRPMTHTFAYWTAAKRRLNTPFSAVANATERCPHPSIRALKCRLNASGRSAAISECDSISLAAATA